MTDVCIGPNQSVWKCQMSQDILAPALEAFVIFDGKNSAECIRFFIGFDAHSSATQQSMGSTGHTQMWTKPYPHQSWGQVSPSPQWRGERSKSSLLGYIWMARSSNRILCCPFVCKMLKCYSFVSAFMQIMAHRAIWPHHANQPYLRFIFKGYDMFETVLKIHVNINFLMTFLSKAVHILKHWLSMRTAHIIEELELMLALSQTLCTGGHSRNKSTFLRSPLSV